MESDTVHKIAELAVEAAGTLHVIGDKTFTPVALRQVAVVEAEPDAVTLRSLTGLVGYLAENSDEYEPAEVLVHVTGPRSVEVVSAGTVGESRQRFRWAVTTTPDLLGAAHVEGRYMPVDEMAVYLGTIFCDAAGDTPDDRAAAIAYCGNIATEAEVKYEDDGFTQKITQRGGVVIVGETSVQNPLALSPFRTFTEVEQPASPYVLRFRSEGKAVACALYLGDGGAWESAAILNVVTYLAETLGDDYTVIG